MYLPFDIIPPIVDQLLDRRDLYAAALVSRDFYRAATPLLYHTLDSRLIDSNKGIAVHHPAATLLRSPALAQYVRCVHESGTVHGAPQCSAQRILPLALRALSMCKKLHSFAWIDDHSLPDDTFIAFLDVLITLPLKELTIRTFSGLGEHVWNRLHRFTRLRSISIWCMEGPPCVMKGWSDKVGDTLTHLELGRCSGVPATLLIFHLSPLHNLTHLRLKGAPSIAIPNILAALPHLVALDTDFDPSSLVNQRFGHRWSPPLSSTKSSSATSTTTTMPLLHSLTVRTSSVENAGLHSLWPWIRQLAPKCSLQALTLHSVVIVGEAAVQRGFLVWLAEVHAKTMKRIILGSTMVDMGGLRYLCEEMRGLEELVCSVESVDAKQIKEVTSYAHNLRSLRLSFQWYQRVITSSSALDSPTGALFTADDARELMLRPGSRLRQITVGQSSYRGQWVLDDSTYPISRKRFDVLQVLTQNDRSGA